MGAFCPNCHCLPCACNASVESTNVVFRPDHGDKFERIAKALERLVEILEEEQKPGPVITGMG